jgi:hypothetical protein
MLGIASQTSPVRAPNWHIDDAKEQLAVGESYCDGLNATAPMRSGRRGSTTVGEVWSGAAIAETRPRADVKCGTSPRLECALETAFLTTRLSCHYWSYSWPIAPVEVLQQ